jgi:SAM-dependent methyltransferase
MTTETTGDQVRTAVREHYAGEARRLAVIQPSSCCGPSAACCAPDSDYASASSEVPQAVAMSSLGCGNPTQLVDLKPGQVVLDLGSGAGLDVLLSARRVGPTGRAYGLDMTDEMLALARRNATEAGATNVEFLKGTIESIPLPDASVDVIISNCVINLSGDKDAVLGEALRVLRPGGRFAVADIVLQGPPFPDALRARLDLWASCVAGALSEDDYRGKLTSAGFRDVGVKVLRGYDQGDLPPDVASQLPPDLKIDPATRVISAFVSATKPAGGGA